MFMITNDSGDNDDGKIMTMVKMIMTMWEDERLLKINSAAIHLMHSGR